jgi:hypothetical protein
MNTHTEVKEETCKEQNCDGKLTLSASGKTYTIKYANGYRLETQIAKCNKCYMVQNIYQLYDDKGDLIPKV